MCHASSVLQMCGSLVIDLAGILEGSVAGSQVN